MTDLSEVIERIGQLIEFFGWTTEQRKEYLVANFGKRGITLLSEDELRQLKNQLEAIEQQVK
ncbi:MAG TPA: hypothetical protein VK203_27540 [Nostocaceae cyanobacterium]|nr:hypothetical protein [Nostocaceae cyanobacterium]